MSGALLIEVAQKQLMLHTSDVFTFGRASSCTCVLDEMDRGISRIAGAVVWETGNWWVINRSSKRALHVVDPLGISVPLPISRSGWPPPKRAVEPGGLRILVAGDIWTHEIRLAHAEPHLASSLVQPDTGQSTTGQTPILTEARRLVLVALVSGYLRPFPKYDPRPLTYSEIAKLVGLPRSTITKRIEAVRDLLRQS
jgi:hypothetical protein